MRFTRATQCTPEVLAEVKRQHERGLSPGRIAEELARSHAVMVTGQTVRNWLAGRLPKSLPEQGGRP